MGDRDDRPKIKEIIVVEGRDDTDAINKAVDSLTIETHGFGISKETWEVLKKAYKERGLIIFTDPDHAGHEIRKRLKAEFPQAKEAFLPKDKALSGGDIGVENAAPQDIIEALNKAKAIINAPEIVEFTFKDLEMNGLTGDMDSAAKREKVCDELGIGHSNTKTMIKKLNGMGITREEFNKAIEKWTSVK